MAYKIQKTIIAKFLELVDKKSVKESEIVALLDSIQKFYERGNLSHSDLFRQKIEIITIYLNGYLQKLKRKRSSRKIGIEIPADLYKKLTDDIDSVAYRKFELLNLYSLEKATALEIKPDVVKSIFENLVIPKRKLNSELELEKFLFNQLSTIYGKEKVHRQHNIGGFLGLKTDLDIGNGTVGIELKVADKLKAPDLQRLIGQVVYYKKIKYKSDNLLLLMASKKSITPPMKQLIEFVEDLGVTVVFVQAVTI